MNRPRKATNKRVCQDFLNSRTRYLQSNGWAKSQWIVFCEEMLRFGLICELYEARNTVSKYITVRDGNDWSVQFKVRFSDHKPILHREMAGSCDFFVGRTNLKVTTTQMAITTTLDFFKINRWE